MTGYCCPRCHHWHPTPEARKACRESHLPWVAVMDENARAVADALGLPRGAPEYVAPDLAARRLSERGERR